MKGLGTLGRLGLEGPLLFVYPNLLSSGSIYRLEGGERFFVEFFGFLFDNTSPCFLVFTFLFPYSCTLLLLIVVHVLCTKVVSVVCASFTLVSALK